MRFFVGLTTLLVLILGTISFLQPDNPMPHAFVGDRQAVIENIRSGFGLPHPEKSGISLREWLDHSDAFFIRVVDHAEESRTSRNFQTALSDFFKDLFRDKEEENDVRHKTKGFGMEHRRRPSVGSG